MKLLMFTVRDRAANVFAQPFFNASKGAAIRAFGDQINATHGEPSLLSRHPVDFDLFYIGVYDDANGSMDTVAPEQIAVGKDMLVKTG